MLWDGLPWYVPFLFYSLLPQSLILFSLLLAQAPTPGPFVDEARASSEFYSNKLLVQYRKETSDAAKNHVAWVTAWNTFLKELRVYIKNHHTTGLTWNPQVCIASSAMRFFPPIL